MGRKIHGPTKTTMKVSMRFGLISSLNRIQTGDSLDRYVCLACRQRFIHMVDAREHDCPEEQKFRERTGRQIIDFKTTYWLNLAKKTLAELPFEAITMPTIVVPTTQDWLDFMNSLVQENTDLKTQIAVTSTSIETLSQRIKILDGKVFSAEKEVERLKVENFTTKRGQEINSEIKDQFGSYMARKQALK